MQSCAVTFSWQIPHYPLIPYQHARGYRLFSFSSVSPVWSPGGGCELSYLPLRKVSKSKRCLRPSIEKPPTVRQFGLFVCCSIKRPAGQVKRLEPVPRHEMQVFKERNYTDHCPRHITQVCKSWLIRITPSISLGHHKVTFIVNPVSLWVTLHKQNTFFGGALTFLHGRSPDGIISFLSSDIGPALKR